MKKVCYVDTETTGLDPEKQDIIEIAMILELNGKEAGELKINCQPHSFENISQEALAVHGYTVENLRSFMPPKAAHKRVVDFLSGCCDKFDRNDKYYPAGYNGDFDIRFLSAWFRKCGDNYFGSWFNGKLLDPLPMLRMMDYTGLISLPSYKLEAVCDFFGIAIQAHDALSDVKATREILKQMRCSLPETLPCKEGVAA